MLNIPMERHYFDIEDCVGEITSHMSDAWEWAWVQVSKAQKEQKQQYDKYARPNKFSAIDRVLVYTPAKTTEKSRKFARPYHGPYRILEATGQGPIVRPVANPPGKSIRVSLDRLRKCPEGVPNVFWSGRWKQLLPSNGERDHSTKVSTKADVSKQTKDGVWKGRLRSQDTGWRHLD